jgi:hypothetical protein
MIQKLAKTESNNPPNMGRGNGKSDIRSPKLDHPMGAKTMDRKGYQKAGGEKAVAARSITGQTQEGVLGLLPKACCPDFCHCPLLAEYPQEPERKRT